MDESACAATESDFLLTLRSESQSGVGSSNLPDGTTRNRGSKAVLGILTACGAVPIACLSSPGRSAGSAEQSVAPKASFRCVEDLAWRRCTRHLPATAYDESVAPERGSLSNPARTGDCLNPLTMR